ncbi:MAG: sigma-70 family RNA polymerase sigma factor [Candidatus Velamenicoccus archaeovorus]
MDEREWLAARFEEHRTHLRAVAYRMLGSVAEADDAVQEAWIRLSRSDPSGVENLGGWLTTVVGRVCLDMLRSRASRREEPIDERVPEPAADTGEGIDPEREALLGDSVGLALAVVLDTLTPAERVAFVLHDLFDVPFDRIARVVGRSPTAARQLASRGRRRVRGASAPRADTAPQRRVVEAFLVASRRGDLAALIALLDPGVELRADAAAVAMGARAEVRGAAEVAETFSGRARAARLALVDGVPGLVWSRGGRPRVVFRFTVRDGRIVAMEMVAAAERLERIHLAALG